jgi:UDP-glucuronate decarboxylase
MNQADSTGPINLGNPHEFTIKELAELVLSITGSRSKVVYQSLPQDDPTRRRPDISLAQRLLDWQPTVPLAEGLGKTIAWFRTIDPEQYRPPTPNY